MACSEELLKPGQSITPIVCAEEIQTLIENLYDFKCSSITQLNGYDDKNFKVVVDDGDTIKEYVFKIMNSMDSKNLKLVEAQCALLMHLRLNGIPCPTICKNRVGEYYSIEKLISGKHAVKLLEYLLGFILYQVPSSPSLLYEVGKFVAEFDAAAKTFYHQGYVTYKTIWMLQEFSNISTFLYAIEDDVKKKVVEEVTLAFNERVIPFQNELEKGLIHGDFNEQNIVVQNVDGEWKITGILDFGDSHINCYIFELAIAIAYMMIFSKDLDGAGYVIAGYSTVRKLTDMEFSLLKICVAARLCQSLVNSAYSILQNPENTYVLTSSPTAWEILRQLWPLDEKVILSKWKSIAEKYAG